MVSQNTIRVSTKLDKAIYQFLKDLGWKAKISGGKKLSSVEIIRATLSVIMDLDVDVSGVKEESELKRRILSSLGTQIKH